MSAQKIRTALGLLQDDAGNEAAWLELQDAITSPDVGMSTEELVDLLDAARREHEARREWDAVASLLEYQISLLRGSSQEGVLQAELARVLEDELLDDERAVTAYKRLLEIRPNDPTAIEAIERAEGHRAEWRQIAERNVAEARAVDDAALRASMLATAADLVFRYAKEPESGGQVVQLLEDALALDPRNRRASLLLERIHRENGRWEDVARVLELLATESPSRDDRFAALVRLARVAIRKLEAETRGVAAYERALDLAPGYPEAMNYLSDFFSRTEHWDHLVALYEDQLRGGGTKAGQELGIWLQIAMVQWRMRSRADLAEPYFDKVRRAEPAHPGMLEFYRNFCREASDPARLMAVLTDAQRALPDGERKAELAAELAKLAETQEDAHKAIDQYKTLLRQDPDNRDARAALKRLYRQTEAWTSLIDVLRQELDRVPAENREERLSVLHEIAAVYRDRIRSDTALVTVLGQIVALDDTDAAAVRELCRVYESLGRWRDLLVHQQKLAEVTADPAEKLTLLRAAGKRWMEQFQNVQNATEAYEAIFKLEPADEEARGKLKELYTRRRAWPQLFGLLEKEAELAEEAARLPIWVEMAKLAAERLDRSADAVALYKKVMGIDPAWPGVMDALEKQAERDKDFATVAEVLERRVEAATDENARIALLQKVGGVYSDRLNDPRRAAGAWRRVLEVRPGHSRALRVLRDAYLAAEDYDGLAALYAQTDDWEGLAEVLSSAADRAADPSGKVDLSFRVAEVYEKKLGAPERAFRAYERVLSVRPDDVRAAGALIPIYEKDERWSRLPALYEILLTQAESVDDKLALLRKLAEVTGRRLSDKQAALGYARKAYEAAPKAEGVLAMLEECARAAGSWDPFVQALEQRLVSDKKIRSRERRALRVRLAEVYADELGRIDEAVGAYRTLVEEDPSDEGVISTLDRILRQAGRKEDLRWLFELRVKLAAEADAVLLLVEWATLEQQVLEEPARAVELFRRALALDPANAAVLAQLPRLLIDAGDAAAAAAVVESHRAIAQGGARGALELELAELYVGKLDRHRDALDSVARALELGADAVRAIGVLEALIAVDETRPRAAEVLAELHGRLGHPDKEAAALEVLVQTSLDPGRRLELLSALADVREHKLGDPGAALDVVLRAVRAFPQELVLWNRAADLARAASRAPDLAAAYRDAVALEQPLPDAVEVELCERAASLHDEQLGDQDGAIPYLERVLGRQPANDRAFVRLKQILTARERWSDLEALYARAVTGTTDPSRRVELLAEVAIVCEEIIEDAAKAIDYYERILEIDSLHHASVLALEKLYARERRFDRLVQLLERRLETAGPSDVVAIKLRLAALQLDELASPVRALPHVEDVLRLEPNQREARALGERIVSVPELRSRAAEALEAVYEARGDVRDLVRVLEIRLETAADDDLRRTLLRRIASLRDERLSDDAGALEALSKLVPLDPSDVPARTRLVELGRRLSAHERVADVLQQAVAAAREAETRGALLMEVAAIYRDNLGDLARAEAVYRRALELDPSDALLVLPAARALEQIYAAASNHAALVQTLRTEVKLEDDAERRAELYARLGEICEGVLEDPEGAIEAWRARLSDDPVDAAALGALERLYERVSRWRELVEVLRTREQGAADAAERRALMTRIAQTLTDRIGDMSEAIGSWRAIVDEFGPDRPTLQALEALYDKGERWVDLAETLEMDLGLAEEPADKLVLLARLGDVRRAHLEDIPGALDAYRQALTLEPSHGPSREALERMLDEPPARRDAAQVLRPLYEADGDHERLLRVLAIEADTSDSPSERLQLLDQAARVAEGPLDAPARAFDFAVRALREAAGGDEVKPWLERCERLALATRRFGELVALLREVVGQILDGDVQLDVTLRIAELGRTELADRQLARDYYTKALDIRGDERRALVALESLHEESGDAAALLGVIRRRVEVAESEQEKKQLLFRQARLCSEVLSDKPAAIAVYESVLDIDLDPAAVQALEGLYAEAGRFDDLVALYERQLERDPADKADLRVKIAKVADGKLGDTLRAFDELGEALALDATHEGAIHELERLLESSTDPEHRARAGEMLEPFYLGRAEWKRVKVTIEARLSSSQDTDKRRELLRRLALMQEEQEEDFVAALETTAKLLHEDPTDEDTWRQLESQARVAGAEGRLADIFAAELDAIPTDEPATAKLSRRTGELFAALGQVDRALTYSRRALAFEPESRELFDAVDALLVKAARADERVALYRAALDHRFDPADRLALLHTIGELQRTALSRPDEAIETYRQAIDVEDSDAVALDALTDLYRQRGRFRDLADLILRRAEAEDDVDRACGYRLALARLQRDEIHDAVSAIDQLEEIVRRVPSHREAVADLEAMLADEQHKARAVDILLPIYQGADDWRKLIHLNAQRFALATDDLERVAILRETSRLWQERGADHRRAFDALRAAFEIDAESAEIRAEMERLAASLGAWDDLADAYEQAVEEAEGLVARELLAAVAVVHDQRRDHPRRALAAYERLHALDETDPAPLDKMDEIATLLSDWPALVRVLTKKAELLGSDEERAAAWRRVGEAKRDMLDDLPGAIQAYERALELEPASAWALDCLIELYERVDDPRRLVALYGQRVELADADQADLKYELLVGSADRFERQIGDRRAAIDALRSALEVRPADRAVLRKLEGLLRAEREWPELLETLRLESTVADSVEDRAALRRDIGKLLASELGEPTEALEAFRLVLEEVPSDQGSIEAVRALGDRHEQLRLQAADVLEPVLRATGKFEPLVGVLEMRLKALGEPVERARTLRALSSVLDESLSDRSRALDACIRALRETPEDAALHTEVERLAAACDGFGRYADALAESAASTFDGTVARDLWTRLGRVAEDKLGDDRRAVDSFAKALEQAGDAPDLLEPLDRLHEKLGNDRQLAEVLERRVTVEADAGRQADLLHRLAALQIRSFGNRAQGLETLRTALERAPDHDKAREALEELTADRALFDDAAAALESVYRARGDFQRLATLFQKRVGFAASASDRLRLRLDLARVLEEQAADARGAQRVIEEALGDDPTDAEVLSELERLAAINGQWTEAARAASTAMAKTADLDSHTARDLYARLAGWYKDKLADGRAAEEALRQALARDAENMELLRAIEELQREPGRERDLIGTLRRRAALEIDADRRRDLFREAKTLAETNLHDDALAEQILRELVEADETNLWALEELGRLRETAADWTEAVKLLRRRAELTASGPDVIALKHRAAELLRDKLGDNARAIAIYEEILDAEPADSRVPAALRALYAAEKRDKDLATLLEKLIDVATAAAERTGLRLELAQLLASKFDAVSDAISVLHRVLEEEPGQTDAVVALSQLYEKSGRDESLAELLTGQIELARGRGDSSAELTFTVRLGEIYESRLADTSRAIGAYEQVLAREPAHRGALEALGRLFEAKGEPAKAAETLEKLLGQLVAGQAGPAAEGGHPFREAAAAPEADEAVALALRLADLFAKTKDDSGTRRVLERALAVRPDSAPVRERLRKLYERTGAWLEVARLVAQDAEAAADLPAKIKLLRSAADIHAAKRSDPGAAAALLEKASGLAPDDRDLLLALCDAYSASGRAKDAVTALEKIVESYAGKRVKELADIHHRLAKAYAAEGDKTRAITELDQAFRINPGSLPILVDLGVLALDAGDLEKAQKTFRALLLQRLDEKSPITKADIFFYLGDISNRQGDKKKAIQMLERAVENDASLQKARDLLAELKR